MADSSLQPSAVMMRLGGRSYPAEVDPNCKVCCSPYRALIETQIVTGKSYAAVSRSLPADAVISPSNVSRHVKGHHLPLAEDVRRQIVEDRAVELGIDPETHTGALGDYMSMLRVGVNDVMERMVARDIEPTVREGIAMARILAAVGQGDADREVDTARLQTAAIRAVLELVRSMMDDDTFREFSRQLVANPAIRALVATQEAEDNQTIEVGARS